MTTIMQSEIFFFVSTIGFIIIGTMTAILVVLAIRVTSSFLRILTRIESSMDNIGDATLELIDDLRDNIFFRMLFHPKKKHAPRIAKEVIKQRLSA